MDASEFDLKFYYGDNIISDLDLSKPRRPGEKNKMNQCCLSCLDGHFVGTGSKAVGSNPPIHYKNVAG
jgi:hypothetical protein